MTATKSWGPTPTEVGREVDNQVAAPTEREHRANIAHKECGWKDGDRGGLAEWEQTERKKKKKCALTSTGLLMEGLTLKALDWILWRNPNDKRQLVAVVVAGYLPTAEGRDIQAAHDECAAIRSRPHSARV